jgi:uncharacterized protein
MKFDGTVIINAPLEKTWTSLTDPHLVSQCAPGLQSMDILEENKRFKVVAGIGFGAVKVTFDTLVEFTEMQPSEMARVKAHGNAPGSAVDVVSEMRLSPISENITQLMWMADISMVGTVANLASRLMPGITKKLSGEFFNCIKEKIEESTEMPA